MDYNLPPILRKRVGLKPALVENLLLVLPCVGHPAVKVVPPPELFLNLLSFRLSLYL